MRNVGSSAGRVYRTDRGLAGAPTYEQLHELLTTRNL